MFNIIESEIAIYKKEISFNKQLQYAIKIIINAIYGAFGNKYFYFYNRDIAQSITRQGKDLILFSIEAINFYFKNKWHLETELHAKLGIAGRKITPITKNAAIYADTDSTYCNFDLAILSVEGLDEELTPQEKILFCEKLVKYRFEQFLIDAFNAYAKTYNTENYMNFKMESISYNGIWVAKKNYTIKVGYEKFLFDKPQLITKGLENIKPSHPEFARNILTEFVNLILERHGNFSLEREIIPKLKEYRKQIEAEDIDKISKVNYVNTYAEYIKDDKYNELDPNDEQKLINLPDHTPSGVRSSLYYNYFRDKTKTYKYNKIKHGDQVRYYSAKVYGRPELDTFAYIPKQYPVEFAFPVDYDTHFYKTVVVPLNRLLTAIGYFNIDEKLSVDVPVNKATNKTDKSKPIGKVYVIDSNTLEYIEVPSTMNGVFLKERQATDAETSIYESYIYKFGTNTEVVTDVKLESYIEKQKKDKVRNDVRDWLSKLPEDKLLMFEEAIKLLKDLKFKKDIDFSTKSIVIKRSFSKVDMPITENFIINISSVNNAIKSIRKYFTDNEPESNKSTIKEKYPNDAE